MLNEFAEVVELKPDVTDSASVSREFFISVISSLWVLVFKRAHLCNCKAVFL